MNGLKQKAIDSVKVLEARSLKLRATTPETMGRLFLVTAHGPRG
jgi:hypothetical protein